METQESMTDALYRAKFWRTYMLVLCVAILAPLCIGIVTSSVWIGILSYLVINALLSLGVIYKFSIGDNKL